MISRSFYFEGSIQYTDKYWELCLTEFNLVALFGRDEDGVKIEDERWYGDYVVVIHTNTF